LHIILEPKTWVYGSNRTHTHTQQTRTHAHTHTRTHAHTHTPTKHTYTHTHTHNTHTQRLLAVRCDRPRDSVRCDRLGDSYRCDRLGDSSVRTTTRRVVDIQGAVRERHARGAVASVRYAGDCKQQVSRASGNTFDCLNNNQSRRQCVCARMCVGVVHM
jgi:hypothetical protein